MDSLGNSMNRLYLYHDSNLEKREVETIYIESDKKIFQFLCVS